MSRLCLECARRDLPGLLPIPLPAWQAPEATACVGCGVVGEHRYTSIPMSHRRAGQQEAQVQREA